MFIVYLLIIVVLFLWPAASQCFGAHVTVVGRVPPCFLGPKLLRLPINLVVSLQVMYFFILKNLLTS